MKGDNKMINSFIEKIIDGFKFTTKDFIILIVLSLFLWGGYKSYLMIADTNTKVNAMEVRYFTDIEENAFTVLGALQSNSISSPKEILKFLESKPAGKSDLKKGLQNEKIYDGLVDVYGTLAKNAKTALLY